jgi:hypothetical protein
MRWRRRMGRRRRRRRRRRSMYIYIYLQIHIYIYTYILVYLYRHTSTHTLTSEAEWMWRVLSMIFVRVAEEAASRPKAVRDGGNGPPLTRALPYSPIGQPTRALAASLDLFQFTCL